MIFLVILIFNIVFIPNIHSKPVDSSDTQTVNHVPWDAYEYAKNISKQLSKELELNMNKYSGGFKDFESEVGSQTVRFYNGTAEYNDDSVDLANSIANGTFNVKTDKHKTIIEFGPNFKNFSVLYSFVDEARPNSSQFFGIVFHEILSSVTIERDHDNGNIEAKIKYESDQPTKFTFGQEFDAYWNFLEHTHASIKDVDISKLKKDLISKYRRELKERLCNLFTKTSKFLQPQLENIVKLLPFPMENMSEGRWEEISQKINDDGLMKLFEYEYEYAKRIAKILGFVMASFGKVKTWPSVNIPLEPKFRSNSSEDDMLQVPGGIASGIEFAFSFTNPFIQKGSFSIKTIGNTRTIRFAPSLRNYLINYGWKVPGLNGKLDVSYKNIPMEIEVEHNIGTSETKAKIAYVNAPEENERVFVESSSVKTKYRDEKLSPSEKANYEKLNFIMTKYYESADLKNGILDVFQPGSTFLQPVVSIMAAIINFPEKDD